MSKQFLQLSRILGPTLFLFALFSPELALAATEQLPVEPTNPGGTWNLPVAILVLSVAAGSAVLPISALKHWKGQWRLCAALPLLVLLIWLGVITISKVIVVDSHRLWPFEIFAWAMITMIYMVTMMTAKRAFEKKDLENSK